MLGKSRDSKAGARKGFESGMNIFAHMFAAAAAFFGTGPAYSFTIDFVTEFANRHYGPDIIGLVQVGWFIIVAGGIYGLSRATIYTSIMALTFTAAARIL